MANPDRIPPGYAVTTPGCMATGRKLYFPVKALSIDLEGRGYIDPYEVTLGRFGEREPKEAHIIVEALGGSRFKVYLPPKVKNEHRWERSRSLGMPPGEEAFTVAEFVEGVPDSPDPQAQPR